MGRAERRAMMRAETNRNKKLIAEYGRQKRVAGLIQNGITPDDVRNEYNRGLEEGFKLAGTQIIKNCYAGIILALKEDFGFDDDQCFEAISSVDKKVIYSIDHHAMAEQVLRETGLRLDMDDPLERVVRK